MTVSMQINRRDLDLWLRKERGFTLDQFDRLFLPVWPLDENVLYAIVMCESGFKPKADNGLAKGLFQAIPAYFSTANASSRLADHVPTLKQIVARMPTRAISFEQIYLHHYLPAAYKRLEARPECRFVQCEIQENRFASANLQYCSLISLGKSTELTVPVIDTFALLSSAKDQFVNKGIGISVEPVSREFSVAMDDGWLFLDDTDMGYIEWTAPIASLDSDDAYVTAASYLDWEGVSVGSKNNGWAPYSSTTALATARSLTSKIKLAATLTTFTDSGILTEAGTDYMMDHEMIREQAYLNGLMPKQFAVDGADLELFSIYRGRDASATARQDFIDAIDKSVAISMAAFNSEGKMAELAPIKGTIKLTSQTLNTEYQAALARVIVNEWYERQALSVAGAITLFKLLMLDNDLADQGPVLYKHYKAVLAADLATMPREIIMRKLVMHGLYTASDDRYHGTLFHAHLIFPLSLPVVPASNAWVEGGRQAVNNLVSELMQDQAVVQRVDNLIEFGTRNKGFSADKIARAYSEQILESLRQKKIIAKKDRNYPATEGMISYLIQFISSFKSF